jgi:hypothetical protein
MFYPAPTSNAAAEAYHELKKSLEIKYAVENLTLTLTLTLTNHSALLWQSNVTSLLENSRFTSL